MFMGISHHHPQTRPAGNHQQRARNSRRHEIGDIVCTSSRPTECTPTLFFVSDETIGGIEGLVSKQSREAAQEKPEGRRDDAIIEALCETFQRRSGHASSVQLPRVAAHDETYSLPRSRRVART